MLAEPSKDTPWIVLAVVKVAALPVVLALIVAGNDKVIAAVSEPDPKNLYKEKKILFE